MLRDVPVEGVRSRDFEGAVSDCPACRATPPDGARFCPSCGTRLVASAPQATERKVVTTLFADLVGFTALGERHDPEDIDAALRGFYGLARTIVERFGGVVEKFIGDAVVGLFGVPLAHEDDAERAVRAALDLIAHLHELPPVGEEKLQVRCAVNTGPALVWLGARPETGEGVLVGDAVNTAARLLSDAPPMGVVVGELTQRLSSRGIAYEMMAPRAAKGKERPVERWLARGRVARRGADPRPLTAAPMIGREVELATLDALLAKAMASSTPQFALVSGEAGIGKSRLIGEFFRLVDERPNCFVQWRQASCPPYGDDLSFWVLREIVSSHGGILRTDSPEVVDEKLAAILPDPDDEWMRARLRALVGLKGPPVDRDENFTAWLRFLEAMAAKLPTVLVVEDVHWASEPTLAFLGHVVRSASAVPLLVIGSARPEFLDAHDQLRAYRDRVTELHLGALNREDSRRLVGNLTPIAARDDLSESVAEACGGNPLFAEELAWLLSERGLPTDDPGLSGASRPHVIAALMAARVDTLPREQRAVLADASVLGDAFWPGALAALGDTDRPAVDAALARLEAREFVRRRAESTHPDEAQYTFWHTLARDVVYGQLTRDSRAEKHERAAIWFEGHTSQPAGDLADVLAHHYLTALQMRRELKDEEAATRLVGPAAKHLHDAGAKAVSLDLASATRFLQQARDLLPPDHPQRPRTDLLLGKTLAQRGESNEAHRVLQEAIDGFIQLGSLRDAAVATSELSMMTWYMDGDRRYEEFSAQALRLLPDDEPCAELVLVLETCAAVHARHFDSPAVLALADRAIDLAAALGLDPPVRAMHYRAVALCDLGDATGLSDIRRTLEIAKRLSTSDVGVISFNLVQDVLVYEGPPAAITAVEAWRDLAE
jgi:class 3 adenylate cyclase